MPTSTHADRVRRRELTRMITNAHTPRCISYKTSTQSLTSFICFYVIVTIRFGLSWHGEGAGTFTSYVQFRHDRSHAQLAQHRGFQQVICHAHSPQHRGLQQVIIHTHLSQHRGFQQVISNAHFRQHRGFQQIICHAHLSQYRGFQQAISHTHFPQHRGF